MAEKILIVDDDLETLRLVGLMLQRQGYQIIAASNGQQALTLAVNEKPDIVLLDVMMPDMDGYEVTRQLRQMPNTSGMPILMFTAKSLLDDKGAGYTAGVDDYITKPIHPAELVSHIKALLDRTRSRVAVRTERGHVIGCVAPKGGLGVSTLTLNLAVAMLKQTQCEVIAAELRPGQGSWGVELGFANTSGLGNLLRTKPAYINLIAVEKELTSTTFGIRLLLASNHMKDCDPAAAIVQLEAMLQELKLLADYVLLDIGNVGLPGMEKILQQCHEILVVTEPIPATIQRTRMLLDDLNGYGFGRARPITIVVCNRCRSELGMTLNQVQDLLAQPVGMTIPASPETAYNAALYSVPMIVLEPESIAALQFNHLADLVAQHV